MVATRVTQVCNMIAEVSRLLVFHCHISPWHAEVSTTTRTCASTPPPVTAVARDRHSRDSDSAPKMLAPENSGGRVGGCRCIPSIARHLAPVGVRCPRMEKTWSICHSRTENCSGIPTKTFCMKPVLISHNTTLICCACFVPASLMQGFQKSSRSPKRL